MARTRKTVKVDELKNLINAMLEQDCNQDAKAALSIVIEETLHRTGNYKGFRYNDVGDDEKHNWQDRNDENRYNRRYY